MVEGKDNIFQTVGEAAQSTDDSQPNNGLHNTGAADSSGNPVQEIESLCMNCHENGTTRLLFTTIPYFREVVLMSFYCPHCGFKNSELQPAAEIQEKGSKYTFVCETKEDLNRQVIKSSSASCKFVELEIEIPPRKGLITTVEGLLAQVFDDLTIDQPSRKESDPSVYAQIETVLGRISSARAGDILPLTFVLDDPAGNSWVEFMPNQPAHKWSHVEYFRTRKQAEELGMSVDSGAPIAPDPTRNESSLSAIEKETQDIENMNTEVQTFQTQCPSCFSTTPTHMKVVNIPHFKDVILMSTVCPKCGYKTNEVKTGGAIPEKGRRITLKCDEADDLTRDILKSESCGMKIPELNLDLTPGTLGGRFTTLEGLLRQVYDELKAKVFTETSDSMDSTTKANWEQFLGNLQDAIDGKNLPFTVIMEDPLAASYIQNVYAPDPDPNMEIVDYERTEEQNEDLGLNDMVV